MAGGPGCHRGCADLPGRCHPTYVADVSRTWQDIIRLGVRYDKGQEHGIGGNKLPGFFAEYLNAQTYELILIYFNPTRNFIGSLL